MRLRSYALLLCLVPARLFAQSTSTATPPLWTLYATLKSKTWVDLTHSLDSTTPHSKGLMPLERKTLFTVKERGAFMETTKTVGQWGTHVDSPAHFHDGLRTTSDIPVTEMLLPLVVLDVHTQVEKNPDYTLTLADVSAWEAKHGRIPVGSFVAMRSDWSKRWPNQAKIENRDAGGVSHTPGWSMEVLKLLYEDRKVTATGHETGDADPGISAVKSHYALETWLLGTNHYHIENIANLAQVPEAGALIVATWPKLEKGSGFPARVFAVVP